MDFTLKEVWRRTLCCLVSLVILQLLGDTVSVANGEFLHKNDTNISEDSTAAIMDKEAPEENNEGECRKRDNIGWKEDENTGIK